MFVAIKVINYDILMAEIAEKDEFQIKHYIPISSYVHHADVFRRPSAFIRHEVWLLKAGVCKKLNDFKVAV